MSADLLSSIWRHLEGRMDTASLLAEVVGSSSLRLMETSNPSHATVCRQVRRLLVRLRILFDFQRCNFISDVARSRREPRDDFVLAFDTCFETVVYLIHLATSGSPETLGKSDYCLNRNLALETLISSFRLLSLHGTPFTYEQEDILSQRLQDLAGAWKEVGGLSDLEELVICDLLPSTMSEIQDGNGEAVKIQRLACGRYTEASFKKNRTPFCREPDSDAAQKSCIRSTQEGIRSLLKTLDESTWIESFWALSDICWAVCDGKIQRTLSGGSLPPITAAGVLEAGLVGAFNAAPDSPTAPGRERTIIDFFKANIESIVGQWGPTFPAVGCCSDRARRSINAEAMDFGTFLSKRDDILSRQYRLMSRPGTEERLEEDEGGIVLGQQSQLAATQDTSTPRSQASPRTRRDTGDSGSERRKREDVCIGNPEPREAGPDDDPPLHIPPLKIRIERKPVTPSPVLDPSPTVVGTPTGGHGQRPTSYGTDSERSPWPFSPVTPQANFPRPGLPLSPISTPPVQGVGSTVSLDREKYESGLEPVHPDDVPPIFKHGHPSRPQSGLAKVPEEAPTHHFHHLPPSPPPLSPTPDADDAPEVAYPQASTHIRSPSDDTVSVTSTSKKSKKTRMFSLADMGIRFGGRSSPRGNSYGAPAKTPKDLEFVFSASGSILVLYARKGLAYLTKVAAPFHRADRFYLSDPSGRDQAVANGTSPRLVAAGDHSVAAFIVEGDTARLRHWNRAGEVCQLPFSGYPNVVPNALAVSRDDTRVSLACGRDVFLYSRIHGKMTLEATLSAHSKTAQYTAPGRRIQRLNFSLDSKKLIVSTQENEAGTKKPVYVTIYDCFGNSEVRTERELSPVHLNLGYGSDSGLTGIFYSSESNPENARLFLIASAQKPYPSVLFANKSRRNKQLDINERRIDCAAQSPASEPGNEGLFVFKNGDHRICLMDLKHGNIQELADFSKWRPEAMTVAMPEPKLALAFWRAADGGLILKQIPVGRGKDAITDMDLRNVYSSHGI